MNGWWAVPALCMALLVLGSLRAVAADSQASGSVPTVIILRPAASDEVTTEAMARVKGELKAAGFDVVVLPAISSDPKRDLETAGSELHPISAFAIFVKPWREGSSVAEIWVSDRIRQKTVIQNSVLYDSDRGRGSEILAVRAVELLKASLADFWTQSAPPQTASAIAVRPARVHESQPTPIVPFASGPGAGVGMGVMHHSVGATEVSWAPHAIVSYGWPSGFSVRASFRGLGSPVRMSASLSDTATGTAEVEDQLALFEAVMTWWPSSVVVPFVCAGAGAQHLRISGNAPPPYPAYIKDRYALLTSFGVGIGLPMLSGLSFLLQGRAVIAWPPIVVTIGNTNAGTFGALSLLADGALLWVFR